MPDPDRITLEDCEALRPDFDFYEYPTLNKVVARWKNGPIRVVMEIAHGWGQSLLDACYNAIVSYDAAETQMTKQAGLVLITSQAPGYAREILATTNRRYDTIALPGGKVEATDANPRVAAIRELEEETGLILDPAQAVFLGSSINTHLGEDREVHLFFARDVSGELRNREEGTEIRWLSFQELMLVSIFRSYYLRHLPDGVDHLRFTKFL